MAGGGTFEGASARLHVDTKAALAQLRALRDYARIVRADLDGLPIAPGRVPSPLIDPNPSAEIPGSAAPSTKAKVRADRGKAAVSQGEKAHLRRQKAYNKFAGIEDDAAAVASKRAARAFGSPKMSYTPSVAAELSVGEQQIAKLQTIAKRGIGFGAQGPHIGPYQISSHGVGLAHAFNQTVGPYYGYLVGAYLATEAGGFIGRETMSAVRKATARGQTLHEYIADNWKRLGRKLVGKYETAGIKMLDKIADPVRDVIGGVGAALLSEWGAGKTRINRWLDKVAAAKTEVEDFIARYSGGKTSTEIRREQIQQRGVQVLIDRNNARREADKLGKKAAEQLLGLGFPGTLDDLKTAAGDEFYNEWARRWNKDNNKRTRNRVNGKTG